MLSLIRSKIHLLSDKFRYYGLILLSLILCIYSILFIPLLIYFLYRFRKRIKWKILFILIIIFIISFTIFILLKFITFKDGVYKVYYVREYERYSYVVIKKGILKYFFYTQNKLRQGQIVKINGEYIPNLKYNPINNINRYDFIFSNNLISEIKVYKIEIIKNNSYGFLKSYFTRFSPNTREYFNIIFKNGSFNNNILNNLKALNLFYILSFSSFHLIVIEKFILKILYFINIKRSIQKVIVFFFFIVFSFLFGTSFILVKFIIFIMIDIIFDYFSIYIERIDKIFLSFILITIFFPWYIFSLSFKIVYLFSILFYFINDKLKKYHPLLKEILTYYIFQVITLPLISQYINSYSVFLIFITPVFIILFKYFLIPFLYLTFTFYPLDFFTENIIFLLNDIFNFFYLKNLTFPIPRFNIIFLILYYAIFILMIFYKYRLNLIKNIMLFIIITFVNQFKYYLNPLASSYFFNVGQGNFSLVKTSFGISTTVVDFCGDAKKKLDELGVFKIDTLILTHNDKDHIGRVADYKNSLNIDTLILNDTDKYPKLNAKKTILIKNDYKLIKNNLEHIFMKVDNKNFTKNNNSVVFKVMLNKKTILFTGDIEKEAEQLYTSKYKEKLKCDILMVPHHGSSTSSTDDFVLFSDPRYAIFSCGYLNKFKFPHSEVITKYKKIRSEILKTYERKYYKFYFIFGTIYKSKIF